MRKISILSLILIFSFSCTAFAFNNLHLVTSNNYNMIYIDNDSIKYGTTSTDSDDSSSDTTPTTASTTTSSATSSTTSSTASTTTSSATSSTTSSTASSTTSSTETINTNIITYYETVRLSNEGLQGLILSKQKENNHLAKWDQVSYFTTFYSINLENKTIHAETQWFYDHNGVLLYSWLSGRSKLWKEINPGTVIEASYKYVTSYVTDHASELKTLD